MAERPILFSAPMVRAILDGRKTQTRRVVKPQPQLSWPCLGPEFSVGGRDFRCPYGAPGDRLWVREAWRPVMETWRSYVEYGAGGEGAVPGREALEKMKRVALRFPGARKDVHSEAWHPSIHMPRWASRITLTVEAVRVERLQDISEEDARAEGVDPVTYHFGGPPVVSYRDGFEIAWRSINGADSWQANPWVWVINFSRVEVTRG